jgi:hypothetical protein
MLSCLALGADLHLARDSEVTKVSEVSEVRGLVKMLTDSGVTARRGPKVQRGPNFKFNFGPRSASDHA